VIVSSGHLSVKRPGRASPGPHPWSGPGADAGDHQLVNPRHPPGVLADRLRNAECHRRSRGTSTVTGPAWLQHRLGWLPFLEFPRFRPDASCVS
jgi:hypothetical protein